MSKYQNPNADADAPVVRQIVIVLLGFALMAAVAALILNIVV